MRGRRRHSIQRPSCLGLSLVFMRVPGTVIRRSLVRMRRSQSPRKGRWSQMKVPVAERSPSPGERDGPAHAANPRVTLAAAGGRTFGPDRPGRPRCAVSIESVTESGAGRAAGLAGGSHPPRPPAGACGPPRARPLRGCARLLPDPQRSQFGLEDDLIGVCDLHAVLVPDAGRARLPARFDREPGVPAKNARISVRAVA